MFVLSLYLESVYRSKALTLVRLDKTAALDLFFMLLKIQWPQKVFGQFVYLRFLCVCVMYKNRHGKFL